MHKTTFIPLVAALFIGGCDPSHDVHLEPGVRLDSVVFHAFESRDSVGGGELLTRLEVSRCPTATRDMEVVWLIEHELSRTSSSPPAPVLFRYGDESIPGWRTVERAKPLQANTCYMANVTGGGIGASMTFLADSAGATEIRTGTHQGR